MKKLFYIPLFILSIITSSLLIPACGKDDQTGNWPLPKKELRNLEKAVKEAGKYRRESDIRVDSIKKELANPSLSLSQRIKVAESIVEYYRPRMADSSLFYAYKVYNMALKTGDRFIINRGAIAVADAQSASGFFSGALVTFDTISMVGSSREDMVYYWYTGRQMYSNICNYIGEGKENYEKYFAKEQEFVDSLIANLPENDIFRTFLSSQKMIISGQDIQARKKLLPLLESLKKGRQIYGMTAFQLAQSYRRTDQTQYAAYLAMAAESDIIGDISDGFALPTLSEWLYNEHHYQEAFQYINFALNDAYRGGARMRLVNMSSMVPGIDEAYRKKITSSLSDFTLYTVMVSTLLIILIIILALLIKEMKKRRERHAQLALLSKIKDQYIRDFIGLCSAYSEKYDSLAKTVTRKITAGQTQDLLKLVKTGKASESDNEEFYHTIDRVFVSLYPDFIKQINRLLLPEHQYDTRQNNSALTPELRIYGFVRLGVTESAKIAKILNYSSNTVYAYRNRMRNKAYNRDTFDEDVMKIDMEEAE